MVNTSLRWTNKCLLTGLRCNNARAPMWPHHGTHKQAVSDNCYLKREWNACARESMNEWEWISSAATAIHPHLPPISYTQRQRKNAPPWIQRHLSTPCSLDGNKTNHLPFHYSGCFFLCYVYCSATKEQERGQSTCIVPESASACMIAVRIYKSER